MANNEIFKPGQDLSVVVTHPTTPASGDPVRYGKLCGVAQKAELSDGTTSVAFEGVFDVMVDDDAATGIVAGDTLYYQDAATGTPATNVNNNATTPEAVFGTAMEAITANGTDRIRVRLAGGPQIS